MWNIQLLYSTFDNNMPEIGKIEIKRCENCSKRLFDGYVVDGLVNIKCKCGKLNTFEGAVEKRILRKQFVVTR